MKNRCITLPVEKGKEEFSLKMAKELGADAMRNSDGTDLPEQLLNGDYNIYSTFCIARADQKWARDHMDHCHEKYLMSEPVIARSNQVEINPMLGFFAEKYVIDKKHDSKKYWEVINRTTEEVVGVENWNFDPKSEIITIENCQKYHKYSVSFLVFQIWDSVSMYNHLSNDWSCEHVVSTDPYIPESYNHMMEYLEAWLDNNPGVDVVRLTTLAFNFTLDSDENSNPKFVDWVGYTDCVSPLALDDFEKVKGYRLRPEDLVNKGYYNSSQQVPSKRYRDWIDFIHTFVIKFGKEVVDRIHAKGKKAAIFWGDHWIGMEPYSELYQSMFIDINVGACEDGNALRRLADAPGEHTKEIRLYPYFFPDVFNEEGNPTTESISNWLKIRRAILRKPIDRIGWGGYLSLIEQKPKFVAHIKNLADEFRSIIHNGEKSIPYSNNINVVILNAWGKMRSWINTVNIEQKFGTTDRADVVTIFGSNMQECLSGLPVNVTFLSFDNLIKDGIPNGTNVIINEGVAGNGWSGGDYWKNPIVVTKIREFVDSGGGLIGVKSPTAVDYSGRFFQLSDIFGVEKEMGKTIDRASIAFEVDNNHFIFQEPTLEFDAGTEESNIFSTQKTTKVIAVAKEKHILASANNYGKGRAVYLAGLPYSTTNCRVLYRAITWAAAKEKQFQNWLSDNIDTECSLFPKTGYLAITNNSSKKQKTLITGTDNERINIELQPYELKWININSF